MNDPEFKSVLSLESADRYDYFVKKVADFEELWGLWHEGGWAVMSDGTDGECVPVWPHERFAQTHASGDWSKYAPRRIDLEAWLTRWIPGMARDRRKVAVFPDTSGRGIIREPEALKADLELECSRFDD